MNMVKGELIYMTGAWDKEKLQSTTGIIPMTSRTPRAGTLSTELRELMESKVILTEFIFITEHKIHHLYSLIACVNIVSLTL